MSGELQPLDPRHVTAQRMRGWIRFGIVMGVWAAVLLPALASGEESLRWLRWMLAAWGAPVALLLIWLATGWPAVSYRHAAYRIDEQGIEIRSGVVIRRVTSVPRSRVQHTDVSQGPIERRYGLGTLVIHTAGTEFARVALPGLAYGVAASIRDSLLPRRDGDAS